MYKWRRQDAANRHVSHVLQANFLPPKFFCLTRLLAALHNTFANPSARTRFSQFSDLQFVIDIIVHVIDIRKQILSPKTCDRYQKSVLAARDGTEGGCYDGEIF